MRTQDATNLVGVDAIPSMVEGMTLGPVLPDGRQSLIVMSDDSFSGFGPQASQFIALALDLGEVPTMAPLVETPDELRYPGELPEHTLGA